MAARRVAQEMGVRLGAEVGYQVRFEEAASRETRIRFVTEGVLTRRLVGDPLLEGVATVILDEFHERSLAADMSLGLLARLQDSSRRDLKLIVMSATLDAKTIAGAAAILPALVASIDAAQEIMIRDYKGAV